MFRIDELVECALAEDLGTRDVTTWSTVDPGTTGKADITAKEDMTLAGLLVAERVFRGLEPEITFLSSYTDGMRIKKGTVIAEVSGKLSAILSGERVALNFLQRLSGIASLVSSFVELTQKYPVKIVDTRKTTPGLRAVEKYAVQVGGGGSHRWGLFDGILIKDNHIKVCGGVKNAIERAKSKAPPYMKIEVEVRNLKELKEALKAGVDIIMLDNMSIKDMTKAVEIVKKRVLLEASGGIDLLNVIDIAKTGVDIISIGALTHSARAVDIGLEIV
jgi:nicotinate-nucleotide pyrophosphorylase (carboxylating)